MRFNTATILSEKYTLLNAMAETRNVREYRDRHSLNSKKEILYNKDLKENRKYVGLIAGFPNRIQEARQVNQIKAKINVFTIGEKVLCACLQTQNQERKLAESCVSIPYNFNQRLYTNTSGFWGRVHCANLSF